MKVKILKSVAGKDFAYRPDQIISSDAPGAMDLLKAKLAVPVRTEQQETATIKPVEKAVKLSREEYEVMTKNELVSLLVKNGKEFNKRQNKTELIDILTGGDQ